MRKLLDFLFRKRHWWLFLLLEIISFMLVFRDNAYQRNVLISSANIVTGHISSISGAFTAYLNLNEANRKLLERNGELEMQLLQLQQHLGRLTADTLAFTGYVDSTGVFPYSTVIAKVVNSSVARVSNYITINKGKKDGVGPDMGVVSEQGIVGIVSTVFDHFAVVIPPINPKFMLSGKVLGSNYFGSIHWNGRSPRFVSLDELPRHVEFQPGDTIITSGFSRAFPEGIIIGTVHEYERQHDDNFNSLEVELATDFHSLNYVRVIRNTNPDEQQQIEQEAKRHDQ